MPSASPIERMLSPTRAIINGRETILAGTNNYMGITFDPDCIAAGQEGARRIRHRHHRFAHRQRHLCHPPGARERARRLPRPQALHRLHHRLPGQSRHARRARRPAGHDLSSTPIPIPRSMTAARFPAPSSCASATTTPPISTSAWRALDDEEGGRLVVLEGIYSMLGDRAPLADFVAVKKKHGFQLVVDEAHSFGVLGPEWPRSRRRGGPRGRRRFHRRHVLQEHRRHRRLRGRQPSAVRNHPLRLARPTCSLPLPRRPPLRLASAALRKLAAEPERRERIMRNSQRLFDGFRGLGLDLGCDEVSPVIAVTLLRRAFDHRHVERAARRRRLRQHRAAARDARARSASCAARCRRRIPMPTSTRSSRCSGRSSRRAGRRSAPPPASAPRPCAGAWAAA